MRTKCVQMVFWGGISGGYGHAAWVIFSNTMRGDVYICWEKPCQGRAPELCGDEGIAHKI